MIGNDGVELSKEELKAVRRLKKLAKEWPKSLWLLSNGFVHVMRANQDGTRKVVGGNDGAFDQGCIVATIADLPSDGGDF